jgi:protein-tyrosine phosphatase
LVDIHSHVLWGMDDGAETLEDSLAMARMAFEHGTTDLIATPHANLYYKFDPELIATRLADLNQRLAGSPRLFSGCDFHLSFENIQDSIANPRKYTLNQGRYLLVEFSELLVFTNTADILGRLLEAGMIPVVTHPERNGLLRQRIESIAEWVSAGTRVQVTSQSLLGLFGSKAREFSRDLLDRRLVHFIASDAHDCERRTTRLDDAYAWIKKEYGEATAEELFVTNPRATLTSEEIDVTASDLLPEPRKWYQIWR